MATLQHRRNKRNRARSIAGQDKPTTCRLDIALARFSPDLRKIQERINRVLHAMNHLASIQTHTLGGDNE